MNQRISFDEFKTYFPDAERRRDGSYQCRCPAHYDAKASLNFCEKAGKILLKCYAGCDTRDILTAVGLTMEDINGRHKAGSWREQMERKVGKKIESVYDYFDEEGRYAYSKVRFEGKYIRYVTVDAAGDSYSSGKGRDVQFLYNLPKLIETIDAGFPVYIVEGEKDVETLRKIGLTATTAGGSSDWKTEFARYFTGARVVILPDNDEPGLELKDRIVKDLRHYAHSIRWTLTSEAEKGDVTDYLQEGRTRDDLKQLIDASENVGAPWLYTTGKGATQTVKVNGDILADSISRNLRYLVVRRPDDDKDDVYLYERGVYSKCNRNQVKSRIRKYIPTGLCNDNLLNNVYNLLLCNGKNIHKFSELDADERYINLKNGLFNIETEQLEPHRADVFSTIQLDCEYRPGKEILKEAKVTATYLSDLCKDIEGTVDKTKMQVLQEFCGLALSNVSGFRSKKALVLWSPLGDSGKSQLLGFLSRLLGGKIANIPIQHMNEDSKFSIGGISDVRLICVGDQTSTDIQDSSLFKQLTGGDVVKIEKKGKQPFYTVFRGVITIACNNLPRFVDDKGSHIFRRLCIVKCEHKVPENERDPEILEKMWTERDAFFSWCLMGLKRLRENGYRFSMSESCETALRDYRSKLDTVFCFISERYVLTGDKSDMVSKRDFEENYRKWCEQNEHTGLKRKREIESRMDSIGCACSQGRIGGKAGVMVYRCIKERDNGFYSDDSEDMATAQQEFPD